ncbi:M13 family metallopeptidase [Oligoflexus tunisiensis]|uniref:M13 family metallopeptidase n=1 Tax=Oligoflexus tunisiensis TaxID=708132 RepID=UPI000B0DAB3D|nr:M13 family metallopeptidase [Oligoflexus tunisiensis]
MQFRIPAVLAATLLAQIATAAAPATPAPSSAIPDRREFPVNPNISPCENFYEYACSNVISSFKLRDDRSSHTFAFSDSRERILDKKKAFLQDLDQQLRSGKALSDRSKTLATVYGACMNVDGRKKEEQELVKDTLAKLDKIKTREQFLKFLAEQRDAALPTFVDVGSTANQDNPDHYDFLFMGNLMTLPERSYYLKPDVAGDYQKVIEKFFTTIGDKKAAEKAKTVLAMETDFAKVYPLPAEMREIFTRKTSISKGDVLKKYPSFQLAKELERVPNNTNIRHFVPETYAYLEKTLAKEDLNKLKMLYAYQALSPVMDDAYPDFFNTRFAFRQKHLGDSKVRPERQERCTQMVMRSFNKELDAEVLPLMFPNFPEEKFIALAESVRSAIIEGVKENKWLTPEGKAGAIAKMKNAKLQLVKPRNEEEWHFNPTATYSLTTPLANHVALEKALTERMYKELAQKRNKNRWGMGPLTVNAYYSPADNKFVMPIGILQYPFYDPSLPVEVNLGAVGAVIGHELGHGIDDQGAKYDDTGKLRQWMSNQDVDNFKKRGRAFVEQFNEIGHNGELTLGENIGDLTGVTFAYRAAFPNGKGDKEKKKAFFLQYARVWCGVELPKMAEAMLKTDPHSRGWARVNQQVKNQPAFAEVFSCKKTDAMVLPEDKQVRIW